MGALLDTNIVLDALARRKPWHKDAQELLFLASCGKCDLHVSGSTIIDIYYLVNKHVYHDKSESLRVVDVLMESLNVVNVGVRECLMATHGEMLDFEDAVVAEAARSAGLDYIVTRNMADYAGSPVTPILPADYLELILAGKQ